MRTRLSPFVERFVYARCASIQAVRDEYDGACIDFAGDLCEEVPGARLAYFDGLDHPAWKYHAAMVLDGWVHDLWYPMLPLDVFMSAIGATTVEYPSEES